MLSPQSINDTHLSHGHLVPRGITPLCVSGELSVSLDSAQVTAFGEVIPLRPTEFRLLHFFMANAEQLFSRAELLEKVWGKEVVVGERTVDVHIRRVRESLEPFGLHQLIQTVHTKGYRFSASAQ